MSDPAWGRDAIDTFAVQQIKKTRLNPSQDADPYTLIRRLYLDLTGLPPTPEQADYWAARIWPAIDHSLNFGFHLAESPIHIHDSNALSGI